MEQTFKPLTTKEREELTAALTLNADSDGKEMLRQNPKDTSFVPTNRVAGFFGGNNRKPTDAIEDEEVIAAIGSVPCHY